MKRFVIFALSVLALAGCCTNKDTQHLKRAADFGRLDEAINAFKLDIGDFAQATQLNSVMVLKDGEIVAEYYDNCFGPDFRHVCWSASKTFTSTAIGLAVDDGLLSVNTKIVDVLGAEELPDTISDTLASLTVYDLLRMASGLRYDQNASGYYTDKSCTKDILSKGFDYAPGERFRYLTSNSYLLSVIVTKVTGKTVKELLTERIFEPMGIRNFHWDESAEGYTIGGYGMYTTTENLAKMGQLYLQGGKWNGKQLISSEWIASAMSAQIYQAGERVPTDDKKGGYGYQMWVNTVGGGARFDGAYGQWSIICPEKNAVIVITQHNNRTAHALTAVWERIYSQI